MRIPKLIRPEWLDDDGWLQVYASADRLSSADTDAAHLQMERIHTPEWTESCEPDHPIVWEQITFAGRRVLLELAYVAAFRPPGTEMIGRLRNARGRFGAAAELRGLGMIMRSGAVLERVRKKRNARLPECIARFPSGRRAVVEVKAIRESAWMREMDRVVPHTHFMFARLAGEVPGFRGHLEWSDAVRKLPPDDAAILVAVQFAVARAKTVCQVERDHSVPAAGLGTLHLTPDASCPSLTMSYGTYSPSDEAIFERLRRRTDEAMKQLAVHPELPGIIVLDIDAFGVARNGLSLLAEWARAQPQLGVVIVVEREHSATVTYGNVLFLLGPRADEVNEVENAFEVCDQNHIHYMAVSSPESPCPCHFWLSRVA